MAKTAKINLGDNKIKNEKGDKYAPIKTVYYHDELNDEFSDAVIESKVIDENYDYLPQSFWWKLGRFFFYRVIATPLGKLYLKLAHHQKTVGRKNLKKVARDEGYFLYGNHTQQTADAFIPSIATFPRGVFVIVHPANVSQKVMGKFTKMLGAIPLPSNIKAMRNFKNAIEKRILQGNCVTVYPEAHIWPYYTGIRPFPATSFKYPAEFDAPAFAMTNVYKKRKVGKKPKIITYIDGPFYPDNSLPLNKRAQDLRDKIYSAMVERSKESDYEYIRYEKATDGENENA